MGGGALLGQASRKLLFDFAKAEGGACPAFRRALSARSTYRLTSGRSRLLLAKPPGMGRGS